MINEATQRAADMYGAGMSLPDVAKKAGVPVSTMRHRLLLSGVKLRSRAEGVRIAAKNGKLSGKKGVPRKPFSRSWRENMAKSRARYYDKIGRAGIRSKPSGYPEFTCGKHKGRLVHVVVMELYIGRNLEKDEVVHHCDENRGNFRLWNLELMLRSEHTRHHRLTETERRERGTDGRFK